MCCNFRKNTTLYLWSPEQPWRQWIFCTTTVVHVKYSLATVWKFGYRTTVGQPLRRDQVVHASFWPCAVACTLCVVSNAPNWIITLLVLKSHKFRRHMGITTTRQTHKKFDSFYPRHNIWKLDSIFPSKAKPFSILDVDDNICLFSITDVALVDLNIQKHTWQMSHSKLHSFKNIYFAGLCRANKVLKREKPKHEYVHGRSYPFLGIPSRRVIKGESFVIRTGLRFYPV